MSGCATLVGVSVWFLAVKCVGDCCAVVDCLGALVVVSLGVGVAVTVGDALLPVLAGPCWGAAFFWV